MDTDLEKTRRFRRALTASPARIAGTLILAFALFHAPNIATAATPFVHEIVDSTGNVGWDTSLALDARGNPHISYFDDTGDDLRYASKVGGAWTIETVDAIGIVGQHSSLALDAQGDPRISYYDGGSGDLKYARKSGAAWTVETVDASGNVGLETSLALDADGNPHISYYDATADDLKYASKSGGTWTIEIVDATGNVGFYTSLALGAQGDPGIGYYDVTNAALKYAAKNNGTWTVETVVTGGGSSPSLARDAQGNPHISYFDAASGNLRYAAKRGAAWAIETADATVTMGSYASLALDEQANPRISYYDDGHLEYAARNAGTWTSETVDATGALVGYDTSLALDAQGNPRISYRDYANGDLRYTDSAVHIESPAGGERWAAGTLQSVRWRGSGSVSVEISKDGGGTYTTLASGVTSRSVAVPVPAYRTEDARVRIHRDSPRSTSVSPACFSIAPDLAGPWWVTTVDAGGSVGSFTSLALDAQGHACISYSDNTNGDLKFASNRGGTWSVEPVDAPGTVGQYTSLALDAQGNPRISYYDATNGDLKYAARTDGTWSLETVDASGTAGQYSSLALDGQGNPAISYYDATNGDLEYAAKSGGTWSFQTVDASGTIGQHTSLELDALGNPRISYYDPVNGYLKYAAKSGGTWGVEVVDGTSGSVGQYTSLALDAQGEPCISYLDGTRLDLKYARKDGGGWVTETVDAAGFVGYYTSLALDLQGDPHIAYYDNTNFDLKYATKIGGRWMIETVDAAGIVGGFASLALDPHDNPRISYNDGSPNFDLKYASAAVELTSPSPGDVWPVGAPRTVSWNGTGRVDVSLSVDGGRTWDPLGTGLLGGTHGMIVPHAPSKFAQVRIERAVPRSVGTMPGLFTIETSVSLLSMLAAPLPDGARGVVVSWRTDPGPDDLAGYRLERAAGAAASGWRTIVSLTRETSHTDPEGGPGSRYRLHAVNGLGEELWLGDTAVRPLKPIAAWPLPYRGGELTVSFATAGGLGAGGARTEVAIYDVNGRLVRRIARGAYAQGYQTVTWDGRDSRGRDVATGVYFIRSRSGGEERTLKLAVLR